VDCLVEVEYDESRYSTVPDRKTSATAFTGAPSNGTWILLVSRQRAQASKAIIYETEQVSLGRWLKNTTGCPRLQPEIKHPPRRSILGNPTIPLLGVAYGPQSAVDRTACPTEICASIREAC
jgi:hypothetical protein